jgi:hypothetical protein
VFISCLYTKYHIPFQSPNNYAIKVEAKWTFLQGHQIIHPYSVKIPRHKLYIYRRFRIIVRGAHLLRYVRLSACISAVPTERISKKFYIVRCL